MPESTYVRATFGVFELRPGRKPVLHVGGRIEHFDRDFGHDYTTSEIRAYAAYGDWKSVSEKEFNECG